MSRKRKPGEHPYRPGCRCEPCVREGKVRRARWAYVDAVSTREGREVIEARKADLIALGAWGMEE